MEIKGSLRGMLRACMGNPGLARATGDSFGALTAFHSKNEIQQLLYEPLSNMAILLGNTASAVFSGIPTKRDDGVLEPSFQISMARVTHIGDLKAGESSRLQLGISYSMANDERSRANSSRNRMRVGSSSGLLRLNDVTGQPLLTCDSGGARERHEYDPLGWPIRIIIRNDEDVECVAH